METRAKFLEEITDINEKMCIRDRKYCDLVAIDLVCRINEGRYPIGVKLPSKAVLANRYHAVSYTHLILQEKERYTEKGVLLFFFVVKSVILPYTNSQKFKEKGLAKWEKELSLLTETV